MHVNTEVTKDSAFNQLSCYSNCYSRVVGCRVTDYLSQVNYDLQYSPSSGGKNLQGSSSSLDAVTSSPTQDLKKVQYSAEIILFYGRREAGMWV